MDSSLEYLNSLPVRKGVRLRGENMTRLEVFSDAAFAFALTMLVVSVGTIPETYDELIRAIKTIPAFALSFIQIATFWAVHRTWSRKYGLEDTTSTILTLAMIFTILVYVYPLRLIFSSFFDFATNGWLPSEFKVTDVAQTANLFAFYGIGYTILASIIMLLHYFAGKKSKQLSLNEAEQLDNHYQNSIWTAHAAIGFSSTIFSLMTPNNIAVYAGFVYFLLGGIIPILAMKHGARIKALPSTHATDSSKL